MPAAPSTCRAQSADGLGDEAQQRRLVGACSGGLLIHAMPDPDTLLRAAGVVKVVEQTWRLDPQGPTGNSSARIGERPRIEPGAVQQAREGEAWYIARGRFEHLMVARTQISDGYRARAHAMVALARSWRPAEVLPGARTWVEAQAAGQEALSGLRGTWPSSPHRMPDGDGSGVARAAGADRAGAGRASAAAGRGRGCPRRRPGRHRHPGPPSPGPRPGRGRAGGGGRGPLAQAPPPPSRLAGRTALDRGPVAAAASASRPGGSWPNRSASHDRTPAPRHRQRPGRRHRRPGLPGVSSGPSRSSPSRPAPSPPGWGGRRRCWSTASPWPPPSRSCAPRWPASGPSTPGAWSPAPPWPRPPSTSPTPPTIRPPRRSPASPRWRCCWPWSC